MHSDRTQRALRRFETLDRDATMLLNRDAATVADRRPRFAAPKPTDNELAERSIDRATVRRSVAPALQQLSAHRQRDAQAYTLRDEDNVVSSDAAELLRSKESIGRILAAATEQYALRVSARNGMMAMSGDIPELAEAVAALSSDMAHELAGASIEDEGSLAAGTSGVSFVRHATSVLGEQLAAAVQRDRERGADLQKLSSEAEHALRLVATLQESSKFDMRLPTRNAECMTSITVPENAQVGVPRGLIALPFELFVLPDGDEPGTGTTRNTASMAQTVAELRRVAAVRADRLVSSFSRREAVVKQLLSQVSELRAAQRKRDLILQRARERVTAAVADILPVEIETEGELADVVEEAVARLYGDVKEDFRQQLGVAVRSAYHSAAEAVRMGKAADEAAERDGSAAAIRELKFALHKSAATLAEAEARAAAAEQDRARLASSTADMDAQLRSALREHAQARAREAMLAETLAKRDAELKDAEARMIELQRAASDDPAKNRLENALVLKCSELDAIKKTMMDLRAKHLDAVGEISKLERDVAAANAAAQGSAAAAVEQLNALLASTTECLRTTRDTLTCGSSGSVFRRQVMDAADDLQRVVCVALSGACRCMSTADAELAKAQLAALRAEQSEMTSRSDVLLQDAAETRAESMAEQAALARNEAKAARQSQADHAQQAATQLLRAIEKERADFTRLFVFSTNALREVWDAAGTPAKLAALVMPSLEAARVDVTDETTECWSYVTSLWKLARKTLLVPAAAAPQRPERIVASDELGHASWLLRDLTDTVSNLVTVPLRASLIRQLRHRGAESLSSDIKDAEQRLQTTTTRICFLTIQRAAKDALAHGRRQRLVEAQTQLAEVLSDRMQRATGDHSGALATYERLDAALTRMIDDANAAIAEARRIRWSHFVELHREKVAALSDVALALVTATQREFFPEKAPPPTQPDEPDLPRAVEREVSNPTAVPTSAAFKPHAALAPHSLTRNSSTQTRSHQTAQTGGVHSPRREATAVRCDGMSTPLTAVVTFADAAQQASTTTRTTGCQCEGSLPDVPRAGISQLRKPNDEPPAPRPKTASTGSPATGVPKAASRLGSALLHRARHDPKLRFARATSLLNVGGGSPQ